METMRDTMLIMHFLSLTTGLGAAFAHMFPGIASSKMEQAEAEYFLVKVKSWPAWASSEWYC